MIVTFFRSSSFNTWDFCQHKYMLDYALGFRSPANKKAEKGTLTHKSLELLAVQKLAQQEGRLSHKDEETGFLMNVNRFTPDEAIQIAWQHYTTPQSPYQWEPVDFKDCRKWMFMALTHSGGMFDPRKRKVIWPEKFFDFTIDQPLAAYNYVLPDGRKLTGHLGLMGTMDLVVDAGSPGVIELIDWKTGQRKDWNTGETKTWKKLRDDPQLRMYHYALSRLMPEAKEIIVTIVFVRDGGAFSLPFCKDDLAKTEAMLQRRFDTIRNCHRPKLILNDGYHKWKCAKLCHFGMNKQPGTNKTICTYMRDELQQLGMERFTQKHGKTDAMTSYGSGGGRSGKEE